MAPYRAATTDEGPLTEWAVRADDGTVVIKSPAWTREAAETVALVLNATHAEATARECLRLRPLLERCLAGAILLGTLDDCVDNLECTCLDPPGDRGNDPDDPEMHSQYCYIYLSAMLGKADAALAADLRRELGIEGK